MRGTASCSSRLNEAHIAICLQMKTEDSMRSLDTESSSAIPPHDMGLPDQPPRRDAGHEQLAACLGAWKVNGTLADSGTRMVCTESYEWLPGKFFIVYR